MITKKILKKITEKGFSLVEVIVASAVLSAAIFGMFSVMNKTSYMGKSIENRIENVFIVSEMRDILGIPSLCEKNFVTDNSYTVMSGPTTGVENDVTQITDANGAILLKKGEKKSDIVIKGIKIGGNPVYILNNSPQIALIPFTITYENIGVSGTKIEQKKTIQLTVEIENNKIKHCNSTGSGTSGHWTKDISNNNLFYNEGNVGINKSTPDQKLDVVGDTRIKGNLNIESIPGEYWFSYPTGGDLNANNFTARGNIRSNGVGMRYIKMDNIGASTSTLIRDRANNTFSVMNWILVVVGHDTGGTGNLMQPVTAFAYRNNCSWYLRTELPTSSTVYLLAIPLPYFDIADMTGMCAYL